ncbi:hypothetical protein DPMN_151431 [Dreissena polymorpha]|uniref:Uncharacterized protein n=1 Tax=Dreissena polymorpha TaxID=45954 RepID=A0A9D4FFA9_DREPO|nr:hypothetical protein DPMN_151431 [Dreissena polymorpha]
MSFLNWLKTGTVQTRSPTIAGLPDPAKAQSTTEALLTQTANVSLEEMVNGRKRKIGEYGTYSDENISDNRQQKKMSEMTFDNDRFRIYKSKNNNRWFVGA